MKKVINHGYRQDMRSICPTCGCEFTYEWEDVVASCTTYSPYTTTSPIRYDIICPECGARYEIFKSTVNYPNITATWMSTNTRECDCDSCCGCSSKKH